MSKPALTSHSGPRSIVPVGGYARRSSEVIDVMGWNWDGATWFGMGVGMLLWLALAVVVVWLIVRGLTALERTRTEGPAPSGPDEILRERFARGEIDADEFERRLTLLRK